MSRLIALTRRIHRGDLAACALLLALAALLFRDHLLRRLTFLGNPDRIQNNLKVVKFYIDSLASGAGLQAWNEHEFLGYDSFALPYINPNPLTFLYAVFGSENLYVTAGYVSALLLAMAGIGAYFFLRAMVERRLPAAVGAGLYMLSAICVLKVSQNDASFLAFVLMPPLLQALRATQPALAGRSILTLAALFYLLMQFVFLQKVAYVLMLCGAYVIYLAVSRRDRRYVLIPGIAFAGAFIAAAPRIAGVALAVQEHSRDVPVYDQMPNGTQLFELLRWFDNTLFASYAGDHIWRLNSLNLSEGMLLYTSAFVPFLILLGALRQARGPLLGEQRFFFWAMLTLFAVVFIPWLTYLLWLLFAKASFIHGRILLAALPAIVALVAIQLREVQPEAGIPLGTAIAGIVAALLAVAGIELIALLGAGSHPVHPPSVLWLLENFQPVAPAGWTPAVYDGQAAVRIVLSGVAAMGLLFLARRRDTLGGVAFVALASAMIIQAAFAANFQINGPHTRGTEYPFKDGNISWVASDKFVPPSLEQRAELARHTDNAHFRSVVICDPSIAGGFCAGHVSEFWGLRLAEGYYGTGVPVRVRALPWKDGVGMRELSITKSPPQWPLLGVVNVRNAIGFTPEVYGYGRSRGGIEKSQISQNPAAVLPRAFFASQVEPVASAKDAAAHIFENGIPRNLRDTSFVEGMNAPGTFAGLGRADVSGAGDRLTVETDSAPNPRFLVLNELFSRRWTATTGGTALRVYATNAVMRGVIVPAGATRVEFHYRPIASLLNCLIAALAGTLLLWFGRRLFLR